MSTALEELAWDRARLKERQHKRTVLSLERVIVGFAKAHRDRWGEIIAFFHDQAGRLDYPGDRDLGALILETVADTAADVELRRFLYNEARYRAMWCTGGATAGGEGIARYSHVRRLSEKLRDCKGPPEPAEPIDVFLGPWQDLPPEAAPSPTPDQDAARQDVPKQQTPEELVKEWVSRISLIFKL